MIFETLPLEGCLLICGEPIIDNRGYFERLWCSEEFLKRGISQAFSQSSISWNEVAGTRRGLHFQTNEYAECKLVKCIAGELFDVIVDIRVGSPTFGKWHAVTLSADKHNSIYIPEGVAHGFQTLMDATTVLYCTSKPYSAEHAAGITSEDPDLGIAWPCPATRISLADQKWPTLAAESRGDL